MNKVQALAIAVSAEERFNVVAWNRGIQRLQTSKRENRIVNIRRAFAVESGAGGRKLGAKEISDKVGRIAEQTWSQAGDLEELEAKAHVTRPADNSTITWLP